MTAINPDKKLDNDRSLLRKKLDEKIRIAAAEALCHMGETTKAIPVFISALDEENLMVRVHVMNSLEILGGEAARAAIPKVQEVLAGREGREYDIRAGKRLIELYGG